MSIPFQLADKIIVGGIEIPSDMIVLLYSHTQKAFHREPLIDYIKTNIRGLLIPFPAPSDFIVVGLFVNEDACTAWYNFLWNRLPQSNPDELSDLTIDDILPPAA